MYCQMIRLHYKCETILLYYFCLHKQKSLFFSNFININCWKQNCHIVFISQDNSFFS
jgi:hypothetical protein